MPETVKTALLQDGTDIRKTIIVTAVAPAMQAVGKKTALPTGSFVSVTVSNLVRLNARLMISVTNTQIT